VRLAWGLALGRVQNWGKDGKKSFSLSPTHSGLWGCSQALFAHFSWGPDRGQSRTLSEMADCLLLPLHLSPLERRLPLVTELAALQARKALLPSFPELVLQQRESETLWQSVLAICPLSTPSKCWQSGYHHERHGNANPIPLALTNNINWICQQGRIVHAKNVLVNFFSLGSSLPHKVDFLTSWPGIQGLSPR